MQYLAAVTVVEQGESDSSSYSPSPDNNMPLQPISLLTELVLGTSASYAPPIILQVNPPTLVTSTPSHQQMDKSSVESPQDVQPPLQR